ncbi:MAG: desulfoferrodoxin [Phascolarctobacterium sp.]|jgi:superoxide reductase|nr:desulfoferrodoxin [Phascolarctobacterium sp.]MBQ5349014.1 desulfoferrodoxin [Phascolarctobacterium sp.]
MKKFFVCKHCGNMIGLLHDAGVPMMCCGEKMVELVPNTTDAAQEKHVPVATVEGNKVVVNVGSVDHPMLDEHWIQWVYLETDKGGHRKVLNPGEKPNVVFALTEDEKPLAVYEYCNLHGLWVAKL